MRITGLTTVVAQDPEGAMEELAPYFLHANNSYGAWFHEDQALGITGMTPMSLEEYKKSGDLQILTPDAAIEKFRGMQQMMPVEHLMMMFPPGLSAKRFMHYAEVFAKNVMPAFA